MSTANKKRHSKGWQAWILVGIAALSLVMWLLLRGRNITLFNPQGYIADEQHRLFVLVGGLLLLTAVPVVLVLYFVAWKYRESSSAVVRDSGKSHATAFRSVMWGFPILCFVLFVSILWPATQQLAPRKVLADGVKPMTIQVVALRWKWLFLYPDQQVASVNFVHIPKDTPVTFELTADDAPMSSFWIPNLGGQLYAMTGHVNHLNLLSSKPGEYGGRSAEINGAGFSGMTFTARVSPQADFDKWVLSTRESSPMLNSASYADLLKPSEANPAAFYGDYSANLYDSITSKYMGSHTMSAESMSTNAETAEHGAH